MNYKISSLFVLFAAMFASSCTLYMDEEENAAPIRFGEGYDKVEKVTLPDGQGTVEYKYSQKTIPIDDELEQYIVKVEDDSILYFMEDTPDLLLPEVGEMLVCSFRERFPKAFAGRVIQRDHIGDLYRCVATSADLFEIFETLKLDCRKEITVEGAKEVDAAEYFKGSDDTPYGGPYDSRQLTRNTTRGWTDFWKNWDLQLGDGKLVELPIEGEIGGSALAAVEGSVKFGGSLFMGPIIRIYADSDKNTMDFSLAMKGGVNLHFAYDCRLTHQFNLPVSIPIYGEKFDFIICGAELGLTATPFIEPTAGTKGEVKFEYDIGIKMGYIKNAEKPDGDFDFRFTTTTREGRPIVTNTFTSDKNELYWSMKAGVDFRCGIGVNPGGTVAVGAKFYGEIDHSFNRAEFTKKGFNTNKYKNKSFKVGIKGSPYAEVKAGCALLEGFARANATDQISIDFQVPWYPDLRRAHLHRRRVKVDEPTYSYSAGMMLNGLGALSWFLLAQPQMAVFDPDGKEIDRIELHQYFGDSKYRYEFTNDFERFGLYKDNVEYKVVPIMHTNIGGIDLDMDPFPCKFISPEIKIIQMNLVETGIMGYKKDKKEYKYRYRIRTRLLIEDTSVCEGVEIFMRENHSLLSKFKLDNIGNKQNYMPVIDWYYYTNKPGAHELEFEPVLRVMDSSYETSVIAKEEIWYDTSVSGKKETIKVTYNDAYQQADSGWGDPDFSVGLSRKWNNSIDSTVVDNDGYGEVIGIQ